MGSLKGSSNSCVTNRSLSFIRTGNFSISVCGCVHVHVYMYACTCACRCVVWHMCAHIEVTTEHISLNVYATSFPSVPQAQLRV